MNWIPLSDESQLPEIIDKSTERPQVIFKHSTRCSVSSMAKNRLEKISVLPNMDFYYLDLIKYRNLSNRIANDFKIRHESPQVIVIKNKIPVYNESHSGIIMDEIIESVKE